MSLVGRFFETLGLKRLIASALSAIVEVLRVIPGTATYIPIIETIAGIFGITGIAHAAGTGTLTKKKLATVSAAVTFLITLSYIPAIGFYLIPFRPYLEKIAGIIGAAAVGARLKEREVEKKEVRYDLSAPVSV